MTPPSDPSAAPPKTLFCAGYGFSARRLAEDLSGAGWRVIGTTRKPEKAEAMRQSGVETVLAPGPESGAGEDPSAALAASDALLISAGPDAEGDPTLPWLGAALEARAPQLFWAGYLSTTGVYGDHQGAWIDETAPRVPATERGRWRVAAEDAWTALAERTGLPLHIFRLAGIYGPGRGPFAKVRAGTARRIVKPGQVFSRIHVDDIAATLCASLARPNPGSAYNVCDNEPAPPQDVIAHAAELLGAPLPPAIPFEEAAATMSPMARSFYAESKRVSNRRIREELGVRLAFPTYREGLAALLAAERRAAATGG